MIRLRFFVAPLLGAFALGVSAHVYPQGYPSATSEAPRGLTSTGDVSMNVVWTLLHVPCVSVPCGTGPGGLPLGIQVIGRIGDDARTLACAEWIYSHLKAGD